MGFIEVLDGIGTDRTKRYRLCTKKVNQAILSIELEQIQSFLPKVRTQKARKLHQMLPAMCSIHPELLPDAEEQGFKPSIIQMESEIIQMEPEIIQIELETRMVEQSELLPDAIGTFTRCNRNFYQLIYIQKIRKIRIQTRQKILCHLLPQMALAMRKWIEFNLGK